MTCAVCAHPDRVTIDASIKGRTPIREIARVYELNRGAVHRHSKRHLGSIVAVVRASERAESRAVHAAVTKALQGSELVSEVTQLRKRADALASQAEASGDARTALLAIRELTRLLELQGRLAIEASQGRAQDVSTHPIFLRFMGKLLQSLANLPGAREVIADLLARELGARVPGG